MRPGLKVIQIAVTRYYSVTIVGWLKHVEGDEWVMLPGARVVNRKPNVPADWNGIDMLASKGPGKRYDLCDPMEQPDELNRLSDIRRCKPANEKAWAKYVPKPAGWVTSEQP